MAIKFNLLGEMAAEFQLCEGRHDSAPIEEAIFPNTVTVMAFSRHDADALSVLEPLKRQGLVRLTIYTSGCTPALIGVLNAATQLRIREVEVYHWDKYNQVWLAQKVITANDVYE